MTESESERKFAVFDIDGTIFRWQLFHEIVFELIEQGGLPADIKATIAKPLERWHHRAHRDAYHDYEHALFESLTNNLPGISGELWDQVSAAVMERSGERVYQYTRDLAQSLKKQGYMLLAISGSFDEAVELFARKYDFDDWQGVKLERKDGSLTGKTKWVHNRKGEVLQEMIDRHNLSLKGSVAVGDTKSDIPLLAMVERPIAFNPNKTLFDHARQAGWKIVVERKNVVYELASTENGYTLQ